MVKGKVYAIVKPKKKKKESGPNMKKVSAMQKKIDAEFLKSLENEKKNPDPEINGEIKKTKEERLAEAEALEAAMGNAAIERGVWKGIKKRRKKIRREEGKMRRKENKALDAAKNKKAREELRIENKKAREALSIENKKARDALRIEKKKAKTEFKALKGAKYESAKEAIQELIKYNKAEIARNYESGKEFLGGVVRKKETEVQLATAKSIKHFKSTFLDEKKIADMLLLARDLVYRASKGLVEVHRLNNMFVFKYRANDEENSARTQVFVSPETVIAEYKNKGKSSRDIDPRDGLELMHYIFYIVAKTLSAINYLMGVGKNLLLGARMKEEGETVEYIQKELDQTYLKAYSELLFKYKPLLNHLLENGLMKNGMAKTSFSEFMNELLKNSTTEKGTVEYGKAFKELTFILIEALENVKSSGSLNSVQGEEIEKDISNMKKYGEKVGYMPKANFVKKFNGKVSNEVKAIRKSKKERGGEVQMQA